jgi:hypothetical protein
MEYLPVSFFQQQLPDLPLSYFRTFAMNNYPVRGEALEILTHHIWLGYLCCRGSFDEVLTFLATQSEPRLSRYINERSNEFWFGNLLHMVLYWNTGDRALDMYARLRELGADPIEDTYGNYPWENKARIWTVPTLRTIYGNRYESEFDDLYARIIQWEIRKIEVQCGIHETIEDGHDSDPLSCE